MACISTRKEMPSSLMRLRSFGRGPSAFNKQKIKESIEFTGQLIESSTRESAMAGRIQDLSQAKVPPNFRGRPAWFVQIWWLVQAILFHPSPQVFYGWRRFLLRLFGA